ncbi:nucleoside hydrolase [Flammeovirga kamogawensis]|uniref:Nucleoside hydrolase n=1 Tax=Flammeovirga kamogawensis TaxID=373891 RepID=A0ABX8H2T1_9BACT|nr:nucleoside hydrolase [Flammeovirga kamogawensis]MBB6460327.1 inosine-uridine nucleoside N-ribohydrolase [Flammeovirga kamogawensis]QWG10136.1 nucleoside hydrolase [Flammeovirga kamogawensis]TRX65645.1 nucleoside hydrolase [Flammeovirga kamogawensis]
MKSIKNLLFVCSCVLLLVGCEQTTPTRISVIFDSDTNNELDDQNALAYLLFNQQVFDIKGITTCATYNGGDIDSHYNEALRVVKLCDQENEVNVIKGANNNFDQIKTTISKANFDGYEAVNFIIDEAKKIKGEKLQICAVGKLTNIALALVKAPEITDKIKVIWLGSNYPDKGEYNQENDVPSVNFVLNTNVEFEMLPCRYGALTGTDGVKIYKATIQEKIAGFGVQLNTTVKGRDGRDYTNFGDYAVTLFKNAEYYLDPPSHALFDMVTVAIMKNPKWGQKTVIPAPVIKNGVWVDRPNNTRKIIIWENYNADKMLDDFFTTLKYPHLTAFQ